MSTCSSYILPGIFATLSASCERKQLQGKNYFMHCSVRGLISMNCHDSSCHCLWFKGLPGQWIMHRMQCIVHDEKELQHYKKASDNGQPKLQAEAAAKLRAAKEKKKKSSSLQQEQEGQRLLLY
ncbi:hypothetical protein AOLI_G00318560 [Acnodon oligacanthus]